MQNTWKSIEEKLAEIAPDILESLNDGATDAQIEALEAKLGVLPQEVKDFYKIHNGQDEESAGLFLGQLFLSLDDITDQWCIWKEMVDGKEFEENGKDFGSDAQEGIKPDFWWNVLWIPISHDGSGNHICLDMDPSEKGNKGQVIEFWHDDASRRLLGNSFKEWIEKIAKDLKEGKIVYDEDYGIDYPMED